MNKKVSVVFAPAAVTLSPMPRPYPLALLAMAACADPVPPQAPSPPPREQRRDDSAERDAAAAQRMEAEARAHLLEGEDPSTAPSGSTPGAPPPGAVAGFVLGEEARDVVARCVDAGYSAALFDGARQQRENLSWDQVRSIFCSGEPRKTGFSPVGVVVEFCSSLRACEVRLALSSPHVQTSAPHRLAIDGANRLREKYGPPLETSGETFAKTALDCTLGKASMRRHIWRWGRVDNMYQIIAATSCLPGGEMFSNLIFQGHEMVVTRVKEKLSERENF